MNSIELIEREIKNGLQEEGLLQSLVLNESQFLFPGYNSVQIVISDGSKIEQIDQVLRKLHARIEHEHGLTFIYSVRATWSLESVGRSEELRTSDGSLTAASVVPVTLRAGVRSVVAHVIVTWEAFQTLNRLVGREFSITEVANTISRDMLARGGTSAWDPIKQPTVQINSSAALYVSRLLRKAA